MRSALIAAVAAVSLGISGCASSGGYGGGYGQGGYGQGGYGGTQISKCTRNALIGAGIGAVAGAVIGSDKNRGENAALGGAAAGLGAFAVCKYLDNQQQARIEGAYANAAANNAPVGMNWVGTGGQTYVLSVNQPYAAGPNCRSLNATLAVGQQGPQPLPQETYCRAPNGAWTPAAY